jgi:regulator of replication initiation timing
MWRGVEEVSMGKRVADDLEPYRRLVELQKQMIKLAEQNERAKRECAALRERVGAEMIARFKERASLRQRLRHKANKILKRLPVLASVQFKLDTAKVKEPSLC